MVLTCGANGQLVFRKASDAAKPRELSSRELRRLAENDEQKALRLLGEPSKSGAYERRPSATLARSNALTSSSAPVSSAVLKAKQQNAEYLRLRAERDETAAPRPPPPRRSASRESDDARRPPSNPRSDDGRRSADVPPRRGARAPPDEPAAPPRPTPSAEPARASPARAAAAAGGLLASIEAEVAQARTSMASADARASADVARRTPRETPRETPRSSREARPPHEPGFGYVKPPPRRRPAPAKAATFGYESLLSDVSRAYCGYDDSYFDKAQDRDATRRAAADAEAARAAVREREATWRAETSARRAADDDARAAAAAADRSRAAAAAPGDDAWLSAPVAPSDAELDARVDALRLRVEGGSSPAEGVDILSRAAAMARRPASPPPAFGDDAANPLARAMALARRPVTPPLAFEGPRDVLASFSAVADAPVRGDVARAPPPAMPAPAGDDPLAAALARAMALSQRPVTPPLAFDSAAPAPPAAPAYAAPAYAAPATHAAPATYAAPAPSGDDAASVLSRAFALAHADVEPPLTFAPL